MNQESNNTSVQNNTNTPQEVKPQVSAPQEIIPTGVNNQTEVSIDPQATVNEPVKEIINTKKNKSSNFFLFFIIILIIVFLLNIDAIEEYFDTNMAPPIVEEEDYSSYNLVDGFIKIDENSSNMKTQKIKFYNFSKKENNTIVYNYVSDIKYDKTSDLEVYIEIYNSNKELLYKEMFNKENIEADSINSTELNLPYDIYQNAYYVLVKKYSINDLNNKITLTCKYQIEDNDVKGNYSIVYTFTNNELSSYEVTKELTIVNGEEKNKYHEKLIKENEELTNNSLTTIYDENLNEETKELNVKLNYNIDLLNEIGSYKPLYEKGKYLVYIKNSEIDKKWNCE